MDTRAKKPSSVSRPQLGLAVGVGVSTCAGGVFANVALGGMYLRSLIDQQIKPNARVDVFPSTAEAVVVATVAGLVVGAITGGAMIRALVGPRWARTLLLVMLATSAVTLLSGLVPPLELQPLASMALSVPAYVLIACFLGERQWRRMYAAARGQCGYCGYTRAGLAPGAVCPECGRALGEI